MRSNSKAAIAPLRERWAKLKLLRKRRDFQNEEVLTYEYIQLVKELCKTHSNYNAILLKAYTSLALCQLKLAKYQDALKSCQQMVQLRRGDDVGSALRILRFASRAYFFLHQFRKAVPNIKQALSIIEEHNLVSKLPEEVADFEYNLSICLAFSEQDFEKSLKLHESNVSFNAFNSLSKISYFSLLVANANGWMQEDLSDATVSHFFDLLQDFDNGHKLLCIGGNQDGAYLVPDDFEGIEFLISPGVGEYSRFEDEIYSKYGIKSILIGPQIPQAIRVKEHVICNEVILSDRCTKSSDYYLGASKFNAPELTLEQILRKNDLAFSSNDLALQLDVEGYEYPCLLEMPLDLLLRFRIIVVEIHHLEFAKVSHIFRGSIIPVLELLTSHFDLLNMHENTLATAVNLSGKSIRSSLELTFHRKDRRKNMPIRRISKHPFNIDNRYRWSS